MTEIFLSLLNVSITAAWAALAVLVLRPWLKKAPKWIVCSLWGVVGLRLVLPFSFESPLSLIPSVQTVPQDIVVSQSPALHTGITAVDRMVNPVIEEVFVSHELTGENLLQTALPVLAAVWLIGIATMLLYGAVTSVRLYRSVRSSVCLRDNIYICDEINTPFILGIIHPRIFLPSGLDPIQLPVIVAHEQTHLKRKDHWWKPLGYGLLTVYWYNPILWIAYILLCRDVELACDEKVIMDMDAGAKKAYSQALADSGCNHRTVMTCPLAFGEIGVKTRIKAVLHYKKPTVWILGTAVVATAVLMVCFLTDPLPCNHTYKSEIAEKATCTKTGVETFHCKTCSYSYKEEIPLTDHLFLQTHIVQDADCLHKGLAEYTCKNCGQRENREILPTAHILGAFTVIKEPAPGMDGERSAWCSGCGREIVYPIKWENPNTDN